MAASPGLSVRTACEADVGVIQAMIRELAEYERLTHIVVSTEADLRTNLFGTSPAAEALVSELDGRVEGFALFFHNYSTFVGKRGIYLEDLFVRPHARGRGLGAALLTHLAQLAVKRGCGRLEWAVLDWNEPAIEFYRRLGAAVLPDWRICRLTGDSLQAAARGQRG
jgi:GNAT superfamily N-acetyltransferase